MMTNDGLSDEPTQRLDPLDPADEPPPRRGRDVLIGVVAAVVGFVLALVVVALGTSDQAPDELAAQERIEVLEAEAAARDAELRDLEARLAEAEAATGEQDEALEAQRRALDERARALDEREAALQQREAAVAERERAPEEPAAPTVPGLDEETAQTVIDRILEQIRDIFQRDG